MCAVDAMKSKQMTSCCAWSKSGCVRLVLLLSFNDVAVPEILSMVRLFRKFPRGCDCTLHLQKLLLLKGSAASLLQTYGGCSPKKILLKAASPTSRFMRLFSSKKSSSRLRLPPPDSCNCYPQMVRLSPDRTPRFSFLLLPPFLNLPPDSSLATSDGRHPRQSFLFFL